MIPKREQVGSEADTAGSLDLNRLAVVRKLVGVAHIPGDRKARIGADLTLTGKRAIRFR